MMGGDLAVDVGIAHGVELFELVADGGDVGDKELPEGGEGHAPGAAVENLPPKLLLHAADGVGEGGLGDEEVAGRLVDGARPRHLNHILDLVICHGSGLLLVILKVDCTKPKHILPQKGEKCYSGFAPADAGGHKMAVFLRFPAKRLTKRMKERFVT